MFSALTHCLRRTAPVAAIVLLATGCGGSSGGSTPQAKATVTVGVLPVIDAAPLEIAIKNGYFTQQGLTVETVSVRQDF